MCAVFAVLSVLSVVGCGGQSNSDNTDSQIAATAAPNQDGYAGNSSVEYQYLGKAIDPDTGREVEGYAIVHYAPGFTPPGRELAAKPPWAGGGGGGGGESTCFAFIANGFKWKTVEDWYLDPTGFPIASSTLLSILNDAVDEWEDEAGLPDAILGNGTESTAFPFASHELDGFNVVYWGDYPQAGVIAVTYTWGVWYGNPKNRYIAEWDQLYDDDWTWSLNGAPGTMDFENIAQHELGHAMGLDHPDSTCTEETMYAYAETGETKKRDLDAGDIAGINDLY
jgi:hypothetical protein